MKVYGLYGEEAVEKFARDQHVNIYVADTERREFYSEARMDELPEEVTDDPESFFLEPTDADGNLTGLREALERGAAAARQRVIANGLIKEAEEARLAELDSRQGNLPLDAGGAE